MTRLRVTIDNIDFERLVRGDSATCRVVDRDTGEQLDDAEVLLDDIGFQKMRAAIEEAELARC